MEGMRRRIETLIEHFGGAVEIVLAFNSRCPVHGDVRRSLGTAGSLEVRARWSGEHRGTAT